MRKVTAAINLTLDGFCDHTAGIPDEELHLHYADLLSAADVILYGRTTYQLMEYWQPFITKPSGVEAMDTFARAIDRIPKVVFSRTLTEVSWESARVARRSPEEEVLELKKQPGRDILVGSPGLIASLTRLGLIDDYQLCYHPVIIGSGLPLFTEITGRIVLQLMKTKSFSSGSIILYYRPVPESPATS